MSYHFADFVRGRYATTAAHWHEHPELLCVQEGLLHIYIQGKQIEAAPGDLIVINPGEIHAIPEKSDDTIYDCLIPQKILFDRMGLPIEDLALSNHICDAQYTKIFRRIMAELRAMPPYYEVSVPSQLISLMVELCRHCRQEHTPSDGSQNSGKRHLIKKVIRYIQRHYAEPISTRDVCSYLGFDKSYVCNNFRAITGMTVIDYLNMIRCEHVQKRLSGKDISVAECAEQCGFHHMSYFTRTYEHYIGELPSATARKRKKNCV